MKFLIRFFTAIFSLLPRRQKKISHQEAVIENEIKIEEKPNEIEKETSMYKVNVSDGLPHYTQRNNEIKPHSSCQVTAMVASLRYRGIRFGDGPYEQPEDNLRHFIETVHGQNPLVHDILSTYTNKWVGEKVTYFSTAVPMDNIIQDILDGKPIVMSGTFPGYPFKLAEPIGHIVSLVGLGWEDDSKSGSPSIAIVDDPYGNTMDNWRGSGDDIEIPWNLFVEWLKPVNISSVKWAHRFY